MILPFALFFGAVFGPTFPPHTPLELWFESQPAVRAFNAERHDLPRTRTTVTDCFARLDRPGGTCGRAFETLDMAGATRFKVGNAGPERYQMLYDRRHHVALVGRGCCSYYDMLLISNVPAPRNSVAQADLSRVSTLRGVRLGMGMSSIIRIFGSPAKQHILKRGGFTIVGYEKEPKTMSPCVEWPTFAFDARQRLAGVYISRGC